MTGCHQHWNWGFPHVRHATAILRHHVDTTADDGPDQPFVPEHWTAFSTEPRAIPYSCARRLIDGKGRARRIMV